MITSALALASRGLPVFPLHSVVKMAGRDGYVCTCGRLSCGEHAGKHPLGRVVPHGHRDATTDARIITHWFEAYPHANLGIATGSVVVVDVDPRHGGDEMLRRIELQHRALPHTWRSITGGGGEHIFFAPPASASIACGKLAEGIDIKAAGGYVVAPPSLHLSGRAYAWNVDHHPDTTPLAPMPAWLAELSRRTSAGRPVEEWRGLVRDGVSEGQRNQTVAKLAGHLLRRYVDPLVVLELVTAWNAVRCQPPLSHSEIVITVDSIARREMARRQQL
jgi:Bifunctional DNA primase/polymerase, N-terminal/Primase C terminal 1 (PriCT-1)